jgi:SAM-dependent methyltransferase
VVVTDQSAGRGDQVRRLFDAKAPGWAAKYAPHGALTGRLDQMTSSVRSHTLAGGMILDIGCGTGELARELAAGGFRVTGTDISAEMLGRARTEDGRGAVRWVRLDARWTTLPFTARTFDAVVAASVLEYVDDPGGVLSECARVLAPGGVVLLTVPDVRHPVRWAEWTASHAARLPLARSGLAAVPKLDGYLAYLRISQQRHLLSWWQAAARQAGLQAAHDAAPSAGGRRRPGTLRVLAFCPADDLVRPM